MSFCKNKILNIFKGMFPFLGIFLVIFVFHFTDWVILKYYPVCVNFSVFCVFFISSFQKETVIQKFAKKIEPDIKPKALEYTRNLTYIWALISFINFSISLLSVFMSNRFWALYNGFISYLFIGSVFVIEYVVRINFKRKHGC